MTDKEKPPVICHVEVVEWCKAHNRRVVENSSGREAQRDADVEYYKGYL